MSITVEKQGRRYYFQGNTFPIKDQLRAAGAKWDAEKKAWWTGQADVAERLTSASPVAPTAPSSSPTREAPGLDATVSGRAEYKGHTYYVAGRIVRGRTRYDDSVAAVVSRDGERTLLYSRDGSMQFWAPSAQIALVKSYRRASTIASLREYAQSAKHGVSYADYQAEIEGAEDMDSFGEARDLERMGYAAWRAQQTRG